MTRKFGIAVAGLLLIGPGISTGAEAALARIHTLDKSSTIASAPIIRAAWDCSPIPGSGAGPQCRWVPTPGWRARAAEGCWIERVPGSGLGPQRVCP